MSHAHDHDMTSETTTPRSTRRDVPTAEYPAVDDRRAHYIRQSIPTGDYASAITPPYTPVDARPLITLQGFVSLRVMYTANGKIVQDAMGSDPSLDLDWHTVGTLRDLGRSEGFDSLGMVTRHVMTIVHALPHHPGFICILVLKQSSGNFALAKVQVQRIFSTKHA